MSRTVYVITYAVCPVLWCSTLQIEIALRNTEVKYIALIQGIREVITFMALMKELSLIFFIHLPNPEVFCKIFEDNQSCTAVAESNNLSPITKHIAIKYHNFRSVVQMHINVYVILIHESKQRKFSLSQSTNHYSSICKENYLDVNLKGENFASTEGSLIIQRKTQTRNSNN